MLPDNFYAQMYNPSYMRTDNAIAISVAGIGGFSFLNQGSFKISDLIATPEGSPLIDIKNFHQNIGNNNHIGQDFAVPFFYVNIPTSTGNFSFYHKENGSSVLKFKKDIIEFLVNGNIEEGYKNFDTKALKFLGSGYRELAFGYAKKKNNKLDFGVHAKLLFGAAYFNADSWNYNIETEKDGSFINFTTGGKGKLMLPVPVKLNHDSTFFGIYKEEAVRKYLNEYRNPGLAIDLGVNYRLNKKEQFSVSLRDLGAIWYRHNGMILSADQKYGYVGFDLVQAIRFPEERGLHPTYLISIIKDSLRNVWLPRAVRESFVSGLAPKSTIHYQRGLSKVLELGVTNQSAFYGSFIRNKLTVSLMQSWPNFSLFENINLHGLNDLSLGGGLQYEGTWAQIFLATDNFFAFYHPANNKTFSISGGICILLNHKKWKEPDNSKGGIRPRKGKFFPELPFYKHLRVLKN